VARHYHARGSGLKPQRGLMSQWNAQLYRSTLAEDMAHTVSAASASTSNLLPPMLFKTIFIADAALRRERTWLKTRFWQVSMTN
jgi:hypothetical protein